MTLTPGPRHRAGMLERARKPRAIRIAVFFVFYFQWVMGGSMWASAAEPGALPVPAFELPPSSYTSPEARAVQQRALDNPDPAFGQDIAAARTFYGRFNDQQLAQMRQRYPVQIRQERMGGVIVHRVVPASGIHPANRRRVLINVHGGAFMWGSGSGALVEAIPIAAAGGIEVITVDYRLAPEHRFPAASEDVAAVYAALLKTYSAASIGIYGCSAGGIITAQAIAWFDARGLPMPGAIGTFCATGAPYGGDSAVLSGPLSGRATLPRVQDTLANAYMSGVAATDPLGYPINSLPLLARFPPTLLLAGSRDFAASALTLMHRKLLTAGVASELVLFDGLGHAFFMRPELPESQEAYALIWRFFDRRLASESHP
ncbi:MAG: alpha/beta hydrolase fold domain-containing protein [Steroidobacteraceae bacterium]